MDLSFIYQSGFSPTWDLPQLVCNILSVRRLSLTIPFTISFRLYILSFPHYLGFYARHQSQYWAYLETVYPLSFESKLSYRRLGHRTVPTLVELKALELVERWFQLFIRILRLTLQSLALHIIPPVEISSKPPWVKKLVTSYLSQSRGKRGQTKGIDIRWYVLSNIYLFVSQVSRTSSHGVIPPAHLPRPKITRGFPRARVFTPYLGEFWAGSNQTRGI